MQLHYLEVVSKDVEGVCKAYATAHGIQFSAPVPELGNALTVTLADGSILGVRAPLRDSENPVVRPYWRVSDIESALTAIVDSGGSVALPSMEIPGRGRIAIYLQGGNDHGLWQV